MAPPSCQWWGAQGSHRFAFLSLPPAQSASKACGRYFSACHCSPPTALALAGTTPGPAPASALASHLHFCPLTVRRMQRAGGSLPLVTQHSGWSPGFPEHRPPSLLSSPTCSLHTTFTSPLTLFGGLPWSCLRTFAPPGPIARGLCHPGLTCFKKPRLANSPKIALMPSCPKTVANFI